MNGVTRAGCTRAKLTIEIGLVGATLLRVVLVRVELRRRQKMRREQVLLMMLDAQNGLDRMHGFEIVRIQEILITEWNH